MRFSALFGSWLVLFQALPVAPQSVEPASVGVIDSIRCDAVLAKSRDSAEIPITEQRDHGRYLHAGEVIRCKSKGSLTLILAYNPLCSEDKPICPTEVKDIPFTVPVVPPATETREQRNLRTLESRALHHHASAAGTRPPAPSGPSQRTPETTS